ncbi:hypothetical protein ElyMa_003929700 [Elysia marginata]|uniref:Deltamethrin resistance protein prag01 domain-containing protein n=1 Tax=Elysia marginata TaxID=1093978 RepID=A0AAV4FRF8_9GAST|nr:hypothetical protein ElyMa_003929700 [Elysia marginata]
MLGRVFLRRLSSLAEPLPRPGQGMYKVPNNARYKKLMEKQTLFCRDDGLMVWQKLPMDNMLYYTAIGLVTVGTIMTFDVFRRLASPPKND